MSTQVEFESGLMRLEPGQRGNVTLVNRFGPVELCFLGLEARNDLGIDVVHLMEVEDGEIPESPTWALNATFRVRVRNPTILTATVRVILSAIPLDEVEH